MDAGSGFDDINKPKVMASTTSPPPPPPPPLVESGFEQINKPKDMSSTTPPPLMVESHGGGEEGKNEKKERCGKLLDLKEAKDQVLFSIPMILTNVSYYLILLISVMFAGHLGKVELAGATLANSWATVTGLALMTGLSGALETFCGQGYGAQQYRKLGIYLQASMITSFFFAVLICILWIFTDPVLKLLHQEADVAKVATIYMQHLIPGLFAYAGVQSILRFLQTQSVVYPLVVCSLVPLLIHVGITYAMVYPLGLGLKGAGLSASISLWLSFIMLALYVKFSKKCKPTWEGFSTECFQYVLPNTKLAIPSAMMVCLEYWAFEILVLVAGLMPNSQSSTALIAMAVNTEAVAFMFFYGFSAAVSTRVSNELGAGNAHAAKNAVTVTLKLAVVLASAVIIFLLIGHNVWASAFSNIPEIKKNFASLTPLLAISIFLDAAQGVLSGVSRGCGSQHLAAWTNLASFYLVGMPIALVLAFVAKLHAKGLWIGLICGLACQASTLLVITLRTKWSKLVLSVQNNRQDSAAA